MHSMSDSTNATPPDLSYLPEPFVQIWKLLFPCIFCCSATLNTAIESDIVKSRPPLHCLLLMSEAKFHTTLPGGNNYRMFANPFWSESLGNVVIHMMYQT